MASDTWRHAEGACPAFLYCRAAESLGVSLNGAPCLFTEQDKTGELTTSARTEIRNLGKHNELAEALLAEAKALLARYDNETESLKAIGNLVRFRRQIFQARRSLWEAMITACRQLRTFTDIELNYYNTRIQEATTQYLALADTCTTEQRISAACSLDRELKQEYSLQFDQGMIEDINRLVSNILNSRPTLLVGDKGIAKTQVAKFVMGLYGADPIVLSVKGDMMSDELIGKLKHDPAKGTFVFQEGVLLTAMRAGLPVLLDELNFGDQAIIARLQDILLKRPGETVFIQESGEESIQVAPGFTVIATANEASLRYRHRAILDPAIRDRFDVIVRTYPDLTIDPLVETSPSLLRIALSSAVDPWGLPRKHINLTTLEKFVRLAHVTQYLYAVPGKDVSIKFEEDHIASSVLEDAQPLMTDCITPRTLSKSVFDCSLGNLPGIKLDTEYIQSILASLDQAGSVQNYQIAEHVSTLLDFGEISAFSWLPEEEQELVDPNFAARKQSRGVFAGLSEGAFASLSEENPLYL